MCLKCCLIILDGFKSHISLVLAGLAKTNEAILYVLQAHTSHPWLLLL